MNATEIISAKRDGKVLSDRQIEFLIDGFAAGLIPDYQMSAFAMAVFFQGMITSEVITLTRAMLNSGQVMTWTDNGQPKVDKHSTGGIGDKISIPLAPILACLGMDVPMISGRGLGATGGTLDKLESIPGFRTDLSIEETQRIVNKTGCVITGASQQIAPADRKLYALRDVTATVPSVPLITASILSKKLAEGLDALVLDVKCGSGAFMKSIEQSTALAKSLVNVAIEFGVNASALITDMNQPLGRMIGNSVEVEESIAILKGEGPGDVRELVLELALELMRCTDSKSDLDRSHSEVQAVEYAISSGRAYERFERMVAEQGGKLDDLTKRAAAYPIVSAISGTIVNFESELIGWAIIELGGGRKKLGDVIDHSVGVERLVGIGDTVEKGQPLFTVFTNQAANSDVESLLRKSVVFGDDAVEQASMILARFNKTG